MIPELNVLLFSCLRILHLLDCKSRDKNRCDNHMPLSWQRHNLLEKIVMLFFTVSFWFFEGASLEAVELASVNAKRQDVFQSTVFFSVALRQNVKVC